MKATNKSQTVRQAIKSAKGQFIQEHGKRVYKADISVRPRWGGGRYILILSQGLSTEYYF